MHFYHSILFVFGFLCIAYSATPQPISGLHATSQNFKRVATDQKKALVKFHHCCSPQPDVETAYMVRLRIKKKIEHDVGGSIPIVFEEIGTPDFVGNTIGFDVIWVENGRQVSITEGKVVEVQTSSGKSTSYWKVELGVVPQAVHVVDPKAGHAGTPGISINDSPVGKDFSLHEQKIAIIRTVLWLTAKAAQSELHLRAIRY
ncbi:hypothetical protein C8R41DRAFT_872344 [Lentinula lateritia]|uniref:Uncharacterized protein n=1 Tax=Lentinula lateritia TaxID=40482 RepID=A0ABQ8UW95_9AGAR|nr:hypothetical protein C8R41DRAFT_872344 [Lentinula lateritia]